MAHSVASAYQCLRGIVFFILFPISCAYSQAEDDSEFLTLLRKFTPPEVPHTQLSPILDKITENNFYEAIRLAEIEIQRPESNYPSAMYATHILAASYYYMAYAYRALGECEESLENYQSSILLGNYGAADEFSEALYTDPIFSHCVATAMTGANVLSTLRNSARLGSVGAAALITNFSEEDGMSDHEASYWSLNAIGGERAASTGERMQYLNRLIDVAGEDLVFEAFKQYSLIGDPILSRKGDVPGRGIAQTSFVESDLRGTYGRLHAGSDGWTDAFPEAPTILENYRLYQRLVAEQGFGNAYLLISSPTATSETGIIQLSASDMVNHISVGDRLFFSCGALSHVAVLFDIDRENHTLGFIDAAYQFWQPSHNACITDFVLKKDDLGKFISYVDWDEAMRSLVAIIAIRD